MNNFMIKCFLAFKLLRHFTENFKGSFSVLVMLYSNYPLFGHAIEELRSEVILFNHLR